jgi:hypothetical protein
MKITKVVNSARVHFFRIIKLYAYSKSRDENGNGNFRIPEIVFEVLPKFRFKRNGNDYQKYGNGIGRKTRNRKRKRFGSLPTVSGNYRFYSVFYRR